MEKVKTSASDLTARKMPSSASRSALQSQGSGKSLGDLSRYANYESSRGEVVSNGTGSSADHIAAKVTSALSDAVAAVDRLKLARQQLDDITNDETLRSQEMAQIFQRASHDVSLAVKFAPVLVSRTDLTDLFAAKRFLVTADTAGKASGVVRKSERWLKGIVKDIGQDLVAARREAARVTVQDSL